MGSRRSKARMMLGVRSVGVKKRSAKCPEIAPGGKFMLGVYAGPVLAPAWLPTKCWCVNLSKNFKKAVLAKFAQRTVATFERDLIYSY